MTPTMTPTMTRALTRAMTGSTQEARARLEPPAEALAVNYHMLRAASARHGRDPTHLGPAELAEVAREAERSRALEALVLASDEARGVRVPADELDAALEAIAARYADAAEMGKDLASNGLDRAALRAAVERELVFDAVLRRVANRHPAVTDDEVEAFYHRAPERFAKPERRTVSHILITVNEQFVENRRAAAARRIEAISAALDGRPQAFAQMARQHSECPTALQGGRLGTLPRGRLYPQLDAVLFTLAEGAISAPVESEVGWHLLHCERILDRVLLPLSEVRERIRALLTEHRHQKAQRAWIAQLRQANGPANPSR